MEFSACIYTLGRKEGRKGRKEGRRKTLKRGSENKIFIMIV